MKSRYAAVVAINGPSVNREELLIRIERALATSAGRGERVQIVGHDATLAEDMFVRLGRTPDGKRSIAICNLSHHTRSVRLIGGIKPDDLRDVLSRTLVAPGKLHIAP